MIDRLSKWLLRLRNRHFFIIDAIILTITPVLALILRLDSLDALKQYGSSLLAVIILFLAVKLAVFYTFGFYRRYWRFASIDELVQMAMLTIVAVILQTLLLYETQQWIGFSGQNLPRSLPLLDGLLSFILIGGFRFSVRAVERVNQRYVTSYKRDHVLVVGAGSAGVSIVQEMQQNPQLRLYPVAFVDDDPRKLNLHIRGLPVVGDRHKIPEVVPSLHIRRVIIAIPSASGSVIREVVDICQATGVQTSTLPGVHEILTGHVRVDSIRKIQIEDLLRRAPVQMNKRKISRFLAGKKVLITGAGGSIGSELCRQILKCRPAEILLIGHGENSVFNIQQELKQVLPVMKNGRADEQVPHLTSFIVDIRFPSRLEYAFDQFRPDIIFHAAAHKHVPMMELNSPEAVTNNVLGTKNLLDLALKYNVENFVMLSTDKAVNPTSIMGASKRVAEMLVLQAARKSGKPFVAVRFGNVLGSRGSIVPIIRKQIANGGPVTVTHPEICRYFMTIPEAVQLVLQASVIGRGGEVFVLNMGQPVKIVDLARDLIRLSGYEVDRDIKIVFTGLRPGEKLFEELFIPGEQYKPTQHKKILTAQNASSFVPRSLDLLVRALCTAADKNDFNSIVFLLQQLVTEYTPQRLTADAQAGALEQSAHTAVQSLDIGARHGEVIDTAMHDCTIASLQIKNLQQALERQEFRLHYQPILNLETDRIIGFEALMRWKHPKRGLVSPAEFILVAEATDLIVSIGWWVLYEACHQMHTWQEQFPSATAMTISVNLSSKQLSQPDLVKRIERTLQETGLDACSLRLEITESTIMKNSESAAVLSQLKALGVQLQIDNFGIGYLSSSYSYRFPDLLFGKFDRLKVDRSITCRIDSGDRDLETFQTMVTLAQELGIDVTVVGVERLGQIAHIRALRFNHAQGYFFSKPVEHGAARELIGSQPR